MNFDKPYDPYHPYPPVPRRLALALAGGEQVVKAALKIHPEAPTVRQVGQAQLAGGRCLVFFGREHKGRRGRHKA